MSLKKRSNYTYFSFTLDPLSQLHSDIKMNLICWVIPSPCFQFSEDEGSGFSELEGFWLQIVFSRCFLETLDSLAWRQEALPAYHVVCTDSGPVIVSPAMTQTTMALKVWLPCGLFWTILELHSQDPSLVANSACQLTGTRSTSETSLWACLGGGF